MKSCLLDRQQRVRYNGVVSQLKPVSSGVPQGSILGPYLFGLFVASLQPAHPDFTCLLKYVDDICLVIGIQRDNFASDMKKVQDELDSLENWSAVNGLQLNANKTTGLVRYRGAFQTQCPIESILSSISFQSSILLLGVIFHESLGWRSHIDFVEKKCSQRLYILRRIRSFVSHKQFLNVYYGIIRSLLEYACPAFVGLGSVDSKRLERIQVRSYVA